MAAVRDTFMGDDAPKSHDSNDYSDLLQTNHSDAFAFSHQEQSALELYDQLRELELQRSLLEAQNEGMYRVHVVPCFSLNVCSSRA